MNTKRKKYIRNAFIIIGSFVLVAFIIYLSLIAYLIYHSKQYDKQKDEAQALFNNEDNLGDTSNTTEVENPDDIEPTYSTEKLENGFYRDGWEYLSNLEFSDIATWMAEKLDTSWSELFADYSGEQLQRIVPAEYESYSPSQCQDVIFYQAKQEEIPEDIVKEMIEAMLLPMMEPSDIRPFTITKYKIEDQKLIPLKENVWILPVLDGYYSYEGVDCISMDIYKATEPELEKDGLMPFNMQGSDDNFVYILLENNGVYRLQRAVNMINNE